MNRLFNSEFWYNWTPNPGDPGLGDSIIFLIRNLFFGLLFCMPFVAIGHADVGTLLWSSASEEHARLTWMVNAKRMLKAGVLFAVFLALFESLAMAIPTGAFESVGALVPLVAGQVPPTLFHLSATLLGYVLLSRGVSPPRAWLLCATIHLLYNITVAHLFLGR